MAASTEQLFLRFRSTGDPQALGEVFDRTSAPLLSLALHLRGHPADAEDALQATFVTAIERATSWDAARPLLPWLLGILTLHCKKIAERRARRREIELPSGEPIPDPESPLAASERRELVDSLRRHVERLPVEQRQVLLLQLEHGLAPVEVAEVLGIPPGTVRMRLHRGIQQLRGLLPGALVAMLLAMLPSRGVAAVRAEVVRQAGHGAAMVGAGVFGMKKLLWGAVLVVLLVGAAAPWWFPAAASTPPSVERAEAVAVPWHAEGPSAQASAAGQDGASPRPLERVAVAAEMADAEGAMRVLVINRGTGAPVPGMLLTVQPARADVEPGFESTAVVTGADGRVSIDGLAAGGWRVGSSAGDASVVGTVVAEQVVDVVLPVGAEVLQPRIVRGTVRCADGRPAAGATIVMSVQHPLLAGVPCTQADAAGRFAVEFAHGRLFLGAELAGHAPSPLQSVHGDREPELVLGGIGAVLLGKVVDTAGRAIAGASVQVGPPLHGREKHATGGHLELPPTLRRVVSDARGEFALRDLAVGTLGVDVRAPGHAAWHRYVELRAATTSTVQCELSAGQALLGRVVDREGRPVGGARVSLGGSGGEVRTTDDDGRFGYRYVEPGPQRLMVRGAELATLYLERAQAAAAEWEVVVERLLKYRLRFVTSDGAPLAHWRVGASAHDRQRTTDADGGVELVIASGATPDLRLGAPGAIEALQPVAWPLDAVPGVPTTVVVAIADLPSAKLAGRVRASDGSVPTGQVGLRSAAGGHLYHQALVDGRFEFAAVPAGNWYVLVHRPGFGAFGGAFAVEGLSAGERRDLGDLVLPSHGEVACRVVLADGAPAEGAVVFVFDDAEGEHRLQYTDGRAQAWPVGKYRWQVMHDASLWQSGEFEVVAGQPTALAIVLQPGVLRYLEFPLQLPDWGDPATVEFVLRGPDGAIYDQDSFEPRYEFPYRYMPALAQGDWRLELVTDSGLRFAGAFVVESLEPSRTPIRVAVQPAR